MNLIIIEIYRKTNCNFKELLNKTLNFNDKTSNLGLIVQPFLQEYQIPFVNAYYVHIPLLKHFVLFPQENERKKSLINVKQTMKICLPKLLKILFALIRFFSVTCFSSSYKLKHVSPPKNKINILKKINKLIYEEIYANLR